MNDVRHQFDRGTCVAHAVIALAECLMRAAGKVDLSEQHLYWQAKNRDGAPQEKGTYIRIALDCMADTGVCREETWPYQGIPVPGNEGQGPPPDAAGHEAGSYKLSGATQVTERDSSALREVLDGGRPVALSVPVYQNWYGNPATNTYGFIPMPLPATTLEGGHAMCAVGYGYDTGFAGGGYFILRNSWGSTWASQSPIAPGHALLPFRYQDVYGWETMTAEA
jgi:C1A family cysteine protease